MHLKQMTKNLGGTLSKNSPTILTGMAVAGLITTAIFAVKATPKALQLITERRLELIENAGDPTDAEMSKLDIVRLTWKCYIPACTVGVASIGCVIGANKINLRRNAALASVYSITEAAFSEYRSKVVDTIGKNKELKVRDEISADRLHKNSQGTDEVILTGKGDVLCFDTLSGRYFKNNIEQIRKVVNDLNHDLMSDMYFSLNDLYYAMGLPGIKLGEDMGWDIEHGKGKVEIDFSTQLTQNGEPCIVLNYEIYPKWI